MSGNTNCTIYIGNLDERVPERILYDILIQAGRVVELYIPKDKESEKPKGYAFAEYESEEIADYAIKLFSGVVTLYKRTLKFAKSGQDKAPANGSAVTTPLSNSSNRSRPHPVPINNTTEISPHSSRFPTPSKISDYPVNQSQVSRRVVDQSSVYGSLYNNNYEYSRRVFSPTSDSISGYRSRHYDTNTPIPFPHY